MKLFIKQAGVLDGNNGYSEFALPALLRYQYAIDASFKLPANEQRVAIVCDSLSDQLSSILILCSLGKHPVFINPALSTAQAGAMLESVSVKTILGDESAVTKLGARYNVIRVSSPAGITDPCQNEETAEAVSVAATIDRSFRDDFACVLFTSGSSGLPKAVLLTKQNLMAAYNNSLPVLKYSEADYWLQTLPFYHISGFSILFRAIASGASLVIPQDLQTTSLAEAMKAFPISHVSLVPTQLKRFLEQGIEAPQTIKWTLLGGAPSSSPLVADSIKAGWRSAKVYGSTETSAFVAVLQPEDHEQKPNSSGRPLTGVVIDVLTAADPDGIGEIVISSASVSSGYLNADEESKQKFVDGKYHTGDLGFTDADGFLHVIGRIDQTIISGGEKIQPFEVERAAINTGLVESCAVTAIADEEWGEIVACAVVFKQGKQMPDSEFRKLLKVELAGFQMPKKITYLEMMPITETGKIDKTELLELFRNSD